MEKKNHVLAGFAKGNGKVVHVIVKSPFHENITLCEAKPMQFEKDKSLGDVTCKKCQRLKFYKDLLNEQEENKPITPDKEQEEKPLPKEVLKAIKEKPKPKTMMQEITEDIQKDIVENIKEEEIVTTTTIIDEQLKQKINTFQFVKEQYNGSWRIIHQRSGKIFFDNVSEESINTCLRNLNEIERWNGQGTPGSNWFSEVRQAFRLGCLECGIEYPKCLDPASEQAKKELEEKPKTTKPKKPKQYTLPRRKKEKEKKIVLDKFNEKETIKIKRRKPKETKLRRRDKDIFRKSSPKYTIIKAMEQEKKKSEILEVISKKHKIKNELLNIIFSTTVRQAVRIKGKKIQIILQGSDTKGNDDLYKVL